MYEVKDVYTAYRKINAEVKGYGGFRVPKDFDTYFATKLNKPSQEGLLRATNYFNTKWQNVDIDEYMRCGFDLFKTFSYYNITNPSVIDLYIQRDKIQKRAAKIDKDTFKTSLKFINNYMKSKKSSNNILKDYGKLRDGEKSIPIYHYLKQNIDELTLTLIIGKQYLLLEDEDRNMIPYIIKRYRKNIQKLKNIGVL